MLHEKLNCYRKSLILAEELTRVLRIWPMGYGYLTDQIKRAMASVVLNCAEGNAKLSTKDRRKFFQIARASLAEVGAGLDLGEVFNLISQENFESWKRQVHQISRMLYYLR